MSGQDYKWLTQKAEERRHIMGRFDDLTDIYESNGGKHI